MTGFARFLTIFILLAGACIAPLALADEDRYALPSVEINLDVLEQLKREALGIPEEAYRAPQKIVNDVKKKSAKTTVKKGENSAVEYKTPGIKKEPATIIEPVNTGEQKPESILPLSESEKSGLEKIEAEKNIANKNVVAPENPSPLANPDASKTIVETPGLEVVKSSEDPLAYLAKGGVAGGEPSLVQPTIEAQKPVEGIAPTPSPAPETGGSAIEIPPSPPALDAAPAEEIKTTEVPPVKEKGFFEKIIDAVMGFIKSIMNFFSGLIGGGDETTTIAPPALPEVGTTEAPPAIAPIEGVATVPATPEIPAPPAEPITGEQPKAVEIPVAPAIEPPNNAPIDGISPAVPLAPQSAEQGGAPAAVENQEIKPAEVITSTEPATTATPAAPTTTDAPVAEPVKPAETAPTGSVTPPTPGNTLLRLEFLPNSTDLSDSVKEKLDAISKQIIETKNSRYTIVSFASNGTEEGSARKNSLKRALEVRKYLIDKGIDSSRLNVQAMGDATTEAPFDRVEITPSLNN